MIDAMAVRQIASGANGGTASAAEGATYPTSAENVAI